MKTSNIKILFLASIIFLTISGCKKDVVVSKATFWPSIVINGGDFTVVPVGTTYTDASATVTVNGAAIPFETVSDVDATEVGAYTVSYTALNEDGISASQTRTVIVVDADALRDDLTGSYTRSGVPGTVINWAKDGDYTYIANNLGGVSPTNTSYSVFNVNFVVYNVAPGIVVVPKQDLGGIGINSAAASLGGPQQIPFNTAAVSGDVAYAWVALGPNFGTGLRTFKKI